MEFMKLNIQLFAISNNATNSGLRSDAGNKATVEVKFTERALTDQNIANNTTTIDLEATYTQDTGSWYDIKTPWFYLEWYDDKRATWTIVDDENVQSMARYDKKTLKGTIDVEHKDNGTLTGKARARWVYEKSSTLVPRNGNATTSDTVLTQVPRKNSISSYNGYIEEWQTINIGKQASSSTTTLSYSASGNGKTDSGVIYNKYSGTQYTGWKIPASLYKCISSTGTSVTVTLTAETFIDSTSIGTNTTTFIAYTKEAYNEPELSLTVKDVNSATTALTGDDDVVVLNASTMRCTYGATAKNGAYINSANINKQALSINASNISGTKDFAKCNTNVFTMTATDSRGYSNDKDVTLNYISYFTPTLTAVIERNTPTDGKLNITVDGTFYNGSFGKASNALKIQYRYAEKGATLPDWIDITPTPSDNNFSVDLQLEGFDYQKAYTVQVQMSDSLNTITRNQDISVGRPSPWWDKENMYVDGSYYKRDNDGVLKRNSTPLDVIELEKGTYLDNIKTPGFYTANSGWGLYQTPVPDGPFTLEVFVAPNGNVKQVYHKHREDNGSRDNWCVATFERSYSTYWTKWTCVSGNIHAYNSTGDYGWYRVLTLSSTSGWGNAAGTLSISTSGGSVGEVEGEISFWYYNNDNIQIKVLNGNIPPTYVEAIRFDDNTVGIFVCTFAWYGPLDVKIKEMTFDYYVSIVPEYIGLYANLPEGTKYYPVPGRSNRNSIIYEGTLKGGGGVTLPKHKRFLDVYATVNFDNGMTTIKYTIDTINSNSEDAFGSGVVQCFDVANGIEYYMSECKVRNGVLTHTKIGYFNVSTGVYNERLWNASYYVYRVETYD